MTICCIMKQTMSTAAMKAYIVADLVAVVEKGECFALCCDDASQLILCSALQPVGMHGTDA